MASTPSLTGTASSSFKHLRRRRPCNTISHSHSLHMHSNGLNGSLHPYVPRRHTSGKAVLFSGYLGSYRVISRDVQETRYVLRPYPFLLVASCT
jgi:hypothetical protein